MKKLLILLGMIIFLTSCGSKEPPPEETKQTDQQAAPEENKEEAKEPVEETKEEAKPAKENLTIDDTWEVPGQWKLKINSVELTNDRNEYSEKTPAQVFIVNYTYENLGYEDEDDIMDLYLTPDRIMDDSGKMGYTYPASIVNYPQELPVGGTVDAQDAWGVDNETKTVKIYFSSYDMDTTKQEAVFEVPVQ
ncbi:MAG: hypothetical protein Q4G11_00195 [Gallicola sp.]|nr:hypothetical protein [Gallicola sp.]